MKDAPFLTPDRTAPAPDLEPEARPTQRAKSSNHPDLLPGVKLNSSEGRRYRDLVRAYLVAIGRDLDEFELGQLQDLAALKVLSEQLHARRWNGEPVDVGELCQLTSTRMRLATRLGLKRKPHEASPGGPLGRLLVADYERQQIADRERDQKRREEFEAKHAPASNDEMEPSNAP